ncbi:MAG: C10 family peptidase [Muribaculaceae bacterium]|nr:C10 family peptidase [Muribaculaceae bacterium]
MKKILLVLLPVLLIGCSQIEVPPTTPKEEQKVEQTRSAEDVIKIAEHAKMLFDKSSRNADITVNNNSIKAICRRTGRGTAADTLMYAVDYNDNKGFVLVSAINGVAPIIGIAEEGSFNSPKTAKNANFQFFMNNAIDYIEYSLENPEVESDVMPFATYDTIKQYTTYPARIKTKWDQGWPANLYCANESAGCAPLAVAQMLAYLRSPEYIDITYPNADTSFQMLNWDQILRHQKTQTTCDGIGMEIKPSTAPSRSSSSMDYSDYYFENCTASKETHEAIGRLVRQIGQLAGADYSSITGTSTTYYNIKTAVRQLLNNRTLTERFNANSMYNDMIRENVVGFIKGEDRTLGGHAWLIDGAMLVEYKLKYNDGTTSSVVKKEKYIHHNWGFGGDSNGYFLEGVFDTSKRYGNSPVIIRPKSRSSNLGNYSNSISYFILQK